jgi:recombinational DNA repair protein (RecF pathway)
MSLSATTERALVLCIEQSGESFHKLDVLTRETGYILCLQRISKKRLSQTRPDFLDTAEILMDSSRQGEKAVRFIKEYHLIERRSNIGQSYRTLQCASKFCSLIARNAPHMADPEILYEITERTLNAFAENKPPEIIFLKALYLLLKDEGYPVRESWWPQLSEQLRNDTKEFINNPTPDSASAEQIKNCMEISDNLGNWLSRETALVLPQIFLV